MPPINFFLRDGAALKNTQAVPEKGRLSAGQKRGEGYPTSSV